MRNIYILDEFQSAKQNGLGVFVKELANFLKKEFNIFILYTNSDIDEFSIEEKQGITLYHIPSTHRYPFSDDAEVINLFISLWIKDGVDNVFIVNHSPCTQLLASLKETHPFSKIVFVIHDLPWRSILNGDIDKYKKIIVNKKKKAIQIKYNNLLNIFENELKFLSLADKVVCLTKDTQKLLLSTYQLDTNKVILINNGLSEHCYNKDTTERELIKKYHIKRNEKILLYVGRVNKMKGGIALLKCFNNVINEFPNCRLVVLGNLNGGEFLNQIGNAMCKVSFTGHLKKEDVYRWYSIAHIGLITSYAEQCSYSAIEMMLHGLPIVASDGYGVRNMFKHQQNALVAKIGNRQNDDEYCKNLSFSIIKLLKYGDLRKRLGGVNRTLFENTYRVEHMGTKYKHLINSL
ncbi:MAG: glycosyltransferase [Dysgonamonadaceae bacterium]